jgi:hypothetical protein
MEAKFISHKTLNYQKNKYLKANSFIRQIKNKIQYL